ncbi:hypothetical protein HDV00_003417 [Rhizophlyctis rosea]|nr:hypothetical protein HDV00_003417 [Rhizophlyctis rosea]
MVALIHNALGGSDSNVSFDAKDMLELLCRFSCNSISVSDGELVNVGVGAFSTLALMNHSCDPNCAIIFQGRTATLRSIKDIKEGEEIVQSYLELSEATYLRRKELKKRYFFDCNCEACSQEETTIFVTRIQEHAFAVLEMDARELFVYEMIWTPLSPPANDLKTRIKDCRGQYEQAEKTINSTPENIPTTIYKTLTTLHKSLSQFCTPTTSLTLHTRRLLLDTLLSSQNYSAALEICTDQLTSLRQIYTPHHPSISVLACMRYKLAAWCLPDDVGKLRELAREAVEGLSVSHGSEQGLCRESVEALEGLRYAGVGQG